MTDTSVSIRIPDDMLERLDAIARQLSERAAGVEVTRSGALRVALDRGLAALEAELGAKRKR